MNKVLIAVAAIALLVASVHKAEACGCQIVAASVAVNSSSGWAPAIGALYPAGQVMIGLAPGYIGTPNPVCGVTILGVTLKCYYDGVNDTLAKMYPEGTTSPIDGGLLF